MRADLLPRGPGLKSPSANPRATDGEAVQPPRIPQPSTASPRTGRGQRWFGVLGSCVGVARTLLPHATGQNHTMAPYFWLQPAVTGAAAILVLLGAGLTIRQRYRADRKDQWWKRTQWAFDLLLTGDEDREVIGLLVLAQQAAAKAADTEDGAFIAEVVQPVVDAYMQTDDTEAGASVGRAGSATIGAEEERPT